MSRTDYKVKTMQKDQKQKKGFIKYSQITKASTERGAVMMIAVIFFIIVASAIALGLSAPVARSYRIANDAVTAKQSYFLAESGTEDAYYRLKSGMELSSSETLVLGGSTTTTTVTDIGSGQKEIASIGDSANRERTVNLKVTVTSGVSFNYGIQAGEGGFNFIDGTVNGNIYANGPIYGDSSTRINGSAISANSPSLVADQSNGAGTPANNVTFGNANGTQDVAQSFQVSATTPVNKIQFYIRKTGSPANATVRIVTDASGSPSTTSLATGTLTASSVTTSYGWIDASFSTNPSLVVGTTYWVVIDAATSASNYYVIGASSGGYGNGLGKIGRYSNSWSNTTPSGLDYYFRVYLGGINGLISSTAGQWNPIPITDTAHANTVIHANVTGTLYCQSGTQNNKACNTSQADPAYIALPISDANIDAWKAEAQAGGTLTGNYSVGWAGATLGPKKIVGNLSISGGGTLTVSGPIWVTGTVTLDGGGTVELASSYGANDGLIISDGTVSVSGGGHATGSGTTGSYIMLMSLSTSSSAMTINGGAGAMIAYAPYGTIAISGGASLKEATAWRITMDGGSTLTYESGLANPTFSSGPSGSYGITSWRETE